MHKFETFYDNEAKDIRYKIMNEAGEVVFVSDLQYYPMGAVVAAEKHARSLDAKE